MRLIRSVRESAMSTLSTPLDPVQMTERCFTVLKSFAKFDELEVSGVVRTLLGTSDREKCFVASYIRSSGNVATLLELKHPKHFQAINMLARTMFELAVDIRLIDVIPKGSEKMIAFVDVEKLRCARKILKFHALRPVTKVDPRVYSTFVAAEGARIDALRSNLWPPKTKLGHWSGMKLPDRIALLKAPFDEIYELNYHHLSWQVHSGLTGVVNLKSETFTLMCGRSFMLAADAYQEVLLAMIEEFRIDKADDKIKGKLKAARMLPFTDTPEQAQQVMDALT
jgi:hypothetical protein